MIDPTSKFPGQPHLVMTYREWLEYEFDPYELILNASALDGSDFHQQHPIGFSVFITDALPEEPRDFKPQECHDWDEPVANAIFRVETTKKKGNIREHARNQIKDKGFIFKAMMDGNTRLSPEITLQWYLDTPFTISPRGHGLDCHRNYEALICKSIPIIMGADETLRLKYRNLPVKFVDNYGILTKPLLRDWYDEILDQTFNFNHLVRSYWEDRRPDVNLALQSIYWLKRFERFDHVAKYFRESDQPTIDSTNPESYEAAKRRDRSGSGGDDAAPGEDNADRPVE